ncbi:uncharacterized protein [Primulina eburnea]|uniref:uncharacterized protein n=1 Tax=Primulina eburnea TaxID=1245227 RepID=UPI003C6C5095
MASVFVLFRMHDLVINSKVLHYFFICRLGDNAFSLSARLNARFLDDIPSSQKGWKGRYFFIKLPASLDCPTGFIPSLPRQPELPQAYKFEEFYTRSLALVEGQKFSSSTLITQEHLATYHLSNRAEDPINRVVDEVAGSGLQPDLMEEAFARRWAAEKAAKEKKRAARKAAAEKRAEDVAARAKETARVQFELKRAEPESREDDEDLLPLSQRPRRVTTIPVVTLSEDDQAGGQASFQAIQSDTPPLLRDDQAPLLEPSQESLQGPLPESFQGPLTGPILPSQPSGSVFSTEGVSRVGADFLKQMLLPTDQAFLKSMPPTPRCLDGLNKLLAVSFFLPLSSLLFLLLWPCQPCLLFEK